MSRRLPRTALCLIALVATTPTLLSAGTATSKPPTTSSHRGTPPTGSTTTTSSASITTTTAPATTIVVHANSDHKFLDFLDVVIWPALILAVLAYLAFSQPGRLLLNSLAGYAAAGVKR
jgi:hypothetical protein